MSGESRLLEDLLYAAPEVWPLHIARRMEEERAEGREQVLAIARACLRQGDVDEIESRLREIATARTGPDANGARSRPNGGTSDPVQAAAPLRTGRSEVRRVRDSRSVRAPGFVSGSERSG